jgi:ParB-like chromosome segregation protein Spo0J
LLSIEEVPTIVLEDLTEEQIRAYIIADNNLAENAGWDKAILAIELQHLMTIEGLDFDITVTGFEVPEIDLIIGETKQAESEREAVLAPEAGRQATLNQETFGS